MSAPAVHSVEETCSPAEEPEKMILFDNKESEKQISVDPISVMTFPLTTDPRPEAHHQRLLTAKSTSKFISCSLPNSANSSPCFDLAFTKHKKKNYKNHHEAGPLARQHSVALGNLERLRESHLRKSKSCGEGRACQPSVDFDMWASQSPRDTQGKREEGRHTLPSKEGEFKCGACLFLPGLGKSKTVRARKEVGADRGMAHMEDLIASQRVSLEKFECGSWRSSAIINCEEDGGGGDAASGRFFDLPVELIRCSSSVNDAESPVTAGFMFDNKLVDHHRNRKGVLKSRKSQEAASSSPRHVRFSAASSPTSCVTPRIHRARDEFSAFLEAQSA